MRKVFVVIGLIIGASRMTQSAVFIFPSDGELVRRSHAIVVATAVRSEAHPTTAGGIETVTTLEVSEVIKGSVPNVIDVHEPGGELFDRALIIPGVPRFEPGERTLLFLVRTPRQTWAVKDIDIGKFSFAHDQAGRRLLVRTEQAISGWDTDGTIHREPRRDADRFLEFLRTEARGQHGQMNYEVPYQPLVEEMKTQSLGKVLPAATFSATSYTSDASSGRGARWPGFPTPVLFFNQNGVAQAGVNATSAAIASWDNDCPSNINYTNAGPDACGCHNTGLAGPDGANVVLWERNLSAYGISPFFCSGSSYSGTLGIGGISSASGTHNGPNGEVFLSTNEADVEMNQGVLACSALINSGNLNSAVTHEIGHTLGFRHSDQTRANNPSVPCSNDPSLECSSSAIMRSSVPGGLNAVLQLWDTHAAVAVYPGGSCTPPPPVGNAATRDFNKDGQSDVMWWNRVTGELVIWFLSSGYRAGGVSLGYYDLNWRAVGAADFNGDGNLDILMRNQATGANMIWLMVGVARQSTVILPSVPTSWFIEATGDLTGDGQIDIIWHDHNNGSGVVWRMSGTAPAQGIQIAGAPVPWHIVGAADLNADGSTDLFWRNAVDGQNAIYRMAGTSTVGGVVFQSLPDTNWRVGGMADYNSDGVADLYWHNVATGRNAIWYLRNFAHVGGVDVDTLADTRWEGTGPR